MDENYIGFINYLLINSFIKYIIIFYNSFVWYVNVNINR